MTSIIVYHRGDRIKIFDERTYQDVEITFECSEEKDNFLLNIVKELLKGDN